MGIFDEIKLGLEQAIEYEKGTLKARKTVLSVLPLERFTAEEIKEIRHKTGLTQALFAKYMGVSVKTVEAWERGRNHPDGAACRLLTITKENPVFPTSSGIVSVEKKAE
jgi:putative transcriptional regulator